MAKKFNRGDIVNYGFYTKVKIIGKDDKHYILRDKRENIKKVYIDLFEKYATVMK